VPVAQIDIKNRRTFLRKTKFDVTAEELFPGRVLNVFSRQMKIVDYADEYTRSRLQARTQRWVEPRAGPPLPLPGDAPQ
jgi:nucleoside-diphosphate kinase